MVPKFHTPAFTYEVIKHSQVGTPGNGGFISGQQIR
jgi:hypothetical protein